MNKKYLLFVLLLFISGHLLSQDTINFTIPECPNIGIKSNLSTKTPLKLYPNPVQNILFIEFDDGFNNYQIDIYDVYGKKFFSKIKTGTDKKYLGINVEKLSKGIYILSIKGRNTSYQKKFIVF